jgi:hypothetical protein
MRALAQKKSLEAKEDVNKPHSERRHCFVMDYSQNLDIPHFGDEQPGETYYYSPLSVYCFGTIDCSTLPEKMHALIYTEGEGKKGGNNVSSLILFLLKEKDLLRKGGNELTIVMDNCTGQNKNRMVLRLAPLLVELGYFKKVDFVFLVRGHTKNICDRYFALMKKFFHRSQVYSYSDLISILNKQEHVTALPMECDVFKNMDDYLNKYYKLIPSGSVSINQIFFSQHDGKGAFCTQTCEGEEVRTNNLKKDDLPTRVDKMMEHFETLTVLPIPGIKPIKQVELWKKWGPNVPEDKRAELCPKPSQEIIDIVMNNKREKVKKNKAEASKLGLDNHTKDDHAKLNKEGEENKTDEADKAPARKRRQQLCSLCGEPGRKNTCKCQNKQDNDKEVLPTESDGNNAACDLA